MQSLNRSCLQGHIGKHTLKKKRKRTNHPHLNHVPHGERGGTDFCHAASPSCFDRRSGNLRWGGAFMRIMPRWAPSCCGSSSSYAQAPTAHFVDANIWVGDEWEHQVHIAQRFSVTARWPSCPTTDIWTGENTRLWKEDTWLCFSTRIKMKMKLEELKHHIYNK